MRRRGERGVRKQRRELRVAPKQRSSLWKGEEFAASDVERSFGVCAQLSLQHRAAWQAVRLPRHNDDSNNRCPTRCAMARLREKRSFLLQAMPFMFLMAAGSWGLSRFLRLPTQVKDDRARRRKQGRAKFDLQQEHEARQHVARSHAVLPRHPPRLRASVAGAPRASPGRLRECTRAWSPQPEPQARGLTGAGIA